jgi:signal transduction histidine kinase
VRDFETRRNDRQPRRRPAACASAAAVVALDPRALLGHHRRPSRFRHPDIVSRKPPNPARRGPRNPLPGPVAVTVSLATLLAGCATGSGAEDADLHIALLLVALVASFAAFAAFAVGVAAGRRRARATDVTAPARPAAAGLSALPDAPEAAAAPDASTPAADGLEEREAQLALTRRLSGWMYWEQDAQGRYLRIDSETDEQALLARQLLGRARWEGGGLLVGPSIAGAAANPSADGDWRAHRELLARGRSFAEMVWSLPVEGGARSFLVESGRPRLDADGAITGYSGLLREIGGALAAERATQSALTALRVAPEPALLIEASNGPAGWRVRWANAAACAVLGRTDTEIVAASPQLLLGPTNQPGIEAIAEALASGRGARLACELPDRYGQSRGASLRVDPLAPLEGMRAQASLSIDLLQAESERLRERAEAAHRLLAEQSSRLQELEQVSRELESFSYTVSHDLRAPLRVVDGFARILKEDFASTLPPEAAEHLERILASATRMDQMIDALLGLARVSAQPLVPAPVDLSLLAQQIADDLRSQQPQRHVEFVIARSMVASGDRTLLRIVLENLLGNAWKYTGRRERAVIAFDCALQGSTMVYRVADNGAGFDMRRADRLFGAFQRLHGANEFAGTGVGLATVARIVQRHRGRIWADGVPGEGARFHFTLNELPPAAPGPGR